MIDKPQRLIIKELREQLGMGQKTFADALGLSVSQYSRKERNPGRFLGGELQVLARLLGAPQDQLLDDSEHQGVSLGSFGRTVQVLNATRGHAQEVTPTIAVSLEAYAIEAPDDSMSGGRRPIYEGDLCIIDPSLTPTPGNPVHAVDPASGENVIRIYSPLHPSNPRAPGVLLKAVAAEVDDIFVTASDAEAIRGPVVEVHYDFD